MLFGVGVSCRILYSIVNYLHVSCSGSITSVGEERANLSAIFYFYLCGFCSERFPFPLVALDGHSLDLLYNYFTMTSSCFNGEHNIFVV